MNIPPTPPRVADLSSHTRSSSSQTRYNACIPPLVKPWRVGSCTTKADKPWTPSDVFILWTLDRLKTFRADVYIYLDPCCLSLPFVPVASVSLHLVCLTQKVTHSLAFLLTLLVSRYRSRYCVLTLTTTGHRLVSDLSSSPRSHERLFQLESWACFCTQSFRTTIYQPRARPTLYSPFP